MANDIEAAVRALPDEARWRLADGISWVAGSSRRVCTSCGVPNDDDRMRLYPEDPPYVHDAGCAWARLDAALATPATKPVDRDACAGCNIRGATHDPRCPALAAPATLDATLASAHKWFDETIPHTADEDVTKFREESREFLENPCVEEAADAILCLTHWAHLTGADLHAAIRTKMEKNAARKWERQPDGTWHHIKPATTACHGACGGDRDTPCSTGCEERDEPAPATVDAVPVGQYRGVVRAIDALARGDLRALGTVHEDIQGSVDSIVARMRAAPATTVDVDAMSDAHGAGQESAMRDAAVWLTARGMPDLGAALIAEFGCAPAAPASGAVEEARKTMDAAMIEVGRLASDPKTRHTGPHGLAVANEMEAVKAYRLALLAAEAAKRADRGGKGRDG